MSVISGYSVLHQGAIHIGRRLRAQLASSLGKSINGLYEAITGAGATGSQRILVHPHDHGPFGGAVIARGGHWTMDMVGSPWAIVCTLADTYYRSTRGSGVSGLATITGQPNFLVDVPWGMDSADTAVGGSAVGLEAKALVYIATAGDPTVSVRWRNRDTGTYSTAQTVSVSTTLTWLTWAGASAIPVAKGRRNQIDLEAASNAASKTLYVLAIQIASTRNSSEKASAGTAAVTSASKP